LCTVSIRHARRRNANESRLTPQPSQQLVSCMTAVGSRRFWQSGGGPGRATVVLPDNSKQQYDHQLTRAIHLRDACLSLSTLMNVYHCKDVHVAAACRKASPVLEAIKRRSLIPHANRDGMHAIAALCVERYVLQTLLQRFDARCTKGGAAGPACASQQSPTNLTTAGFHTARKHRSRSHATFSCSRLVSAQVRQTAVSRPIPRLKFARCQLFPCM
jgi:hypothetical protein